ncbi:hypothetical protein HS088_TW19G00890 [Tripterygium wilfordii]|uniref:DUF7725 domain-containing protein n=2 Tax=Tripterygium wilfordii TaxID=458696 RepID=A0A7J7CAX6_TRIWF|nr:uncharacterized protein LOC119985780 isoform X2 [Tripterygium wilfordii]KAF5731283.1 hypothetical protein HS088_TW19G00890 [Tripterygium wilfordii]
MEATAGVATGGRGAQVSIPSSRKEWRAVSEHHSARNAGDEVDLERSKLGQSDERTIYESRREPADVDFCSITIDGSSDGGLMEQQLHGITRQRQELQKMEAELRAQMIARSKIIEMQNNFNAQIKEHANITSKLQEQLHEREQMIHDLERKMDEKDQELHAIKLDNDAAWAKEDLLREQNKELATFRRERDHSEAERAQHIQQIHDFQEHIQEKERQFIELQEQHRVAQETIMYKDEQLREAQAWIARVQEMDALQSTTNHSLQAELRDRTEQYNQLWLGCQRQFAEMERVHVHAVQQLQLELADARERRGTFNDEAHVSQSNSNDVSQFSHNNINHLDVNGGGGGSNANTGALPNAIVDNMSSFASTGNGSTQTDHVSGVPIAPSSLLGMPTYLPPGQVTALHPYVMHQQAVHHSVPSNVPQSHVGQFQYVSLQQWQDQQAGSESPQISAQDQLMLSEADENHRRPDVKYEYEASANGQALRPDYLDAHMNQGGQPDPVNSSSTGEPKVLESIDRSYLVAPQTEQSLQQISSQFRDALRLDSRERNSETKEQNALDSASNGADVLAVEQSSAASTSPSDISVESGNLNEALVNDGTGSVAPEAVILTGQANTLNAGKMLESALLDERSLLACLVRTIPPGGRVRISSTLPNRLGKMLAPLHWHDYKKRHGKLDDFLASHPELFFIEGDYIQLREGAQEMIAATAAVAKVAAAAAAAFPYSSYLPSVAVTPMAQPRMKKVPSVDSKHVNEEKTGFKEYVVNPPPTTTADNHSQLSVMQNQHLNGVSFGVSEGVSKVKILSKSKDHLQMNGPDFDRSSVIATQIKGSNHGRSNPNFVGKQQSRIYGAGFSSGR